MHRVALVQSRPQNDQQIERGVHQRGAGVMRARIAEDAERKRMVLWEDALSAQCRRDGNAPGLGEFLQRIGGFRVLDARAGQYGDLDGRLAARTAMKMLERRLGGRHRQRVVIDQGPINRRMADGNLCGQAVAWQ